MALQPKLALGCPTSLLVVYFAGICLDRFFMLWHFLLMPALRKKWPFFHETTAWSLLATLTTSLSFPPYFCSSPLLSLSRGTQGEIRQSNFRSVFMNEHHVVRITQTHNPNALHACMGAPKHRMMQNQWKVKGFKMMLSCTVFIQSTLFPSENLEYQIVRWKITHLGDKSLRGHCLQYCSIGPFSYGILVI